MGRKCLEEPESSVLLLGWQSGQMKRFVYGKFAVTMKHFFFSVLTSRTKNVYFVDVIELLNI